jgi:hypothetical protein
MPRGGGTGPIGQDPETGRGVGLGGGGRGLRAGLAPGLRGYCVCPICGARIPREPGTPCLLKRCPKCGARMARECL